LILLLILFPIFLLLLLFLLCAASAPWHWRIFLLLPMPHFWPSASIHSTSVGGIAAPLAKERASRSRAPVREVCSGGAAMARSLRVLVLADNDTDVQLVQTELARVGFQASCRLACNVAEFHAALESLPEVIVAETTLHAWDGPSALRHVRHRGLDLPF